MNKMFKILGPPLLCMLPVGCATNDSEPAPITEAMLVAQEQMFDSLYEGQALEETLAVIENSNVRFFEVKENDVVHQYIEAFRPDTGAQFAVYFENRRLVALILEHDVAIFFSCRRTGPDGHWLSDGITPYIDWITARNMLGKDFDKRAYHIRAAASGGVDFEYAVEAIAWTPVISIALVGAGLDQLAGGHQRDKKARREREYIQRMASTIQIGASEYALISLMGSSDRKDDVGATTAFTYRNPSYSYGFLDDRLVWKESPAMMLRESVHADQCSG